MAAFAPIPATQDSRPTVVIWFKVYAAFLAAIYLAVAAVSLVFFLTDPIKLEISKNEAVLIGILFLALGLLLAVASVIPIFARPRPWSWVYAVILICMGMTSACFLPVCIPLLIFWLKPDVKAYYGKE